MIRRGIHWAWIILAVCFFDLFFNYSIRLGYGVVLPEMIQSLSLNRTQAGAIFNFYLGVYICVTPLAGNLTDRFGARPVITFFSMILGIATLLMGTSDEFWEACLFFGMVGLGASAMWTPVITLVQRWFGPHRKGTALGILSTGYGLGFAGMGWFFPVLVETGSWRLCWYALGIGMLMMCLFNGVFLRSRPEDMGRRPWEKLDKRGPVSQETEGTGETIRFRDIFRSMDFWTIGASYFFAACTLYLVTTFIVDYAEVELGFSYRTASFLATIHGLSQIVGVLTIPMLSDRIGRKLTIIGINGLVAVSLTGIIVSGDHLTGLCASVSALGMFYGATWPMYGACGGDYFRKEVMGTVIGAWTPFYGLGAITAHLVGGRIRDVTGSFQIAFMAAILLAIAAAILMHRAGERTDGFGAPNAGQKMDESHPALGSGN